MHSKEILTHIRAVESVLPTIKAMGDAQFESVVHAALKTWRSRRRLADKAEREADGCKFCGAYHNENCRLDEDGGDCALAEEARNWRFSFR